MAAQPNGQGPRITREVVIQSEHNEYTLTNPLGCPFLCPVHDNDIFSLGGNSRARACNDWDAVLYKENARVANFIMSAAIALNFYFMPESERIEFMRGRKVGALPFRTKDREVNMVAPFVYSMEGHKVPHMDPFRLLDESRSLTYSTDPLYDAKLALKWIMLGEFYAWTSLSRPYGFPHPCILEYETGFFLWVSRQIYYVSMAPFLQYAPIGTTLPRCIYPYLWLVCAVNNCFLKISSDRAENEYVSSVCTDIRNQLTGRMHADFFAMYEPGYETETDPRFTEEMDRLYPVIVERKKAQYVFMSNGMTKLHNTFDKFKGHISWSFNQRPTDMREIEGLFKMNVVNNILVGMAHLENSTRTISRFMVNLENMISEYVSTAKRSDMMDQMEVSLNPNSEIMKLEAIFYRLGPSIHISNVQKELISRGPFDSFASAFSQTWVFQVYSVRIAFIQILLRVMRIMDCLCVNNLLMDCNTHFLELRSLFNDDTPLTHPEASVCHWFLVSLRNAYRSEYPNFSDRYIADPNVTTHYFPIENTPVYTMGSFQEAMGRETATAFRFFWKNIFRIANGLLERAFYFLCNRDMDENEYPIQLTSFLLRVEEAKQNTKLSFRTASYRSCDIDGFMLQLFLWLKKSRAPDQNTPPGGWKVALMAENMNPAHFSKSHRKMLSKARMERLKLFMKHIPGDASGLREILRQQESEPSVQLFNYFMPKFVLANKVAAHFAETYKFCVGGVDLVRELSELESEEIKRMPYFDKTILPYVQALPVGLVFMRPPPALLAMHRACASWMDQSYPYRCSAHAIDNCRDCRVRMPCEMWTNVVSFLLKDHIAKSTGLPALGRCATLGASLGYSNYVRELLCTPEKNTQQDALKDPVPHGYNLRKRKQNMISK